MRVKFWGTHGSVPSPLSNDQVRLKVREILLRAGRELDQDALDLGSEESVGAFIDRLPLHLRGTYGGNTSCVEVRNSSNDFLIIDAGTGLRALGGELMKGVFGQGQGVGHLLMSHFHWDHIQGFPFFLPAYIAGNHLTVWGDATGTEGERYDLRRVFEEQQSQPFFPVGLEVMSAALDFLPIVDPLDLYEGRFRVRTMELDHPGVSRAFRIEAEGASFVYASDAEYKRGDAQSLKPFVDFFQGADALVFDAQFSVVESLFDKRDWGHSAAPMGVEIACAAGVKTLILFHHDPRSEDEGICATLQNSRDYATHVPHGDRLRIVSGYDGMELDL